MTEDELLNKCKELRKKIDDAIVDEKKRQNDILKTMKNE